MNLRNYVALTCKRIRFHSQLDKETFFKWINSIKNIREVNNDLKKIILYVKVPIKDQNLRNLLALFQRYKLPMQQLTIFRTTENEEWFYKNKKAYWHKKVFNKKMEKRI